MTLQFQETANAAVQSSLQQVPSLSAATQTFTETREEPDQDPTAGTATTTFTRVVEESDQDPHVCGLFVFPRNA
jgi:hypothetical protein